MKEFNSTEYPPASAADDREGDISMAEVWLFSENLAVPGCISNETLQKRQPGIQLAVSDLCAFH